MTGRTSRLTLHPLGTEVHGNGLHFAQNMLVRSSHFVLPGKREKFMEFFKWKDQFSVRIPEMDKQHQKFFHLLNQIHHYNEKNNRDSEFLDELFREMFAYVLTHFAEEETLLEQTGFEGLAIQKKQHQFFRDNLVDLRDKHFKDSTAVPQSVLNFMRDWFLNHILHEDKKYGEYFKNQ